MATLAWFNGFEERHTAFSGKGTNWWGSSSGSPTIITTGQRTGDAALEIVASSGTPYVERSTTTSPGVFVVSAYVYYATLPPSTSEDLVWANCASGRTYAIGYNQSTGKWRCGNATTGYTDHSNGPSTGVWYRLEMRVTVTSITNNIAWQIDGVGGTTLTPSHQVTNVSALRLGPAAASGSTTRYDDVVFSYTSGDYPLGEWFVAKSKITACGTHNIDGNPSKLFKYETGGGSPPLPDGTLAGNSETSSYQYLDEWVPDDATDDGVLVIDNGFPWFRGTNASGTQTSNSNAWTITYPTYVSNNSENAEEGDLLILIVGSDGTPTFSATGWTSIRQLSGASNACRLGVLARRVPSGGLSGNFTLNLTASEQGSWKTYVVKAGQWRDSGTLTNDIEAGGDATGTSTSPDPVSFNPTNWDVENTGWMYCVAADHGDTTSTAGPSGYLKHSNGNSGGAGGACVGVAVKNSAAASEDAGAGTISTSEQWASFVVAVRPHADSTTTLLNTYYVEYEIEDAPVAISEGAVMVTSRSGAYRNSTAYGNNTLSIKLAEGGSELTAYNNTSVQVPASFTPLTGSPYITNTAPSGGAWTTSKYNNSKLRFGYTNECGAGVYVDTMFAMLAYKPAPLDPYWAIQVGMPQGLGASY